MMLKKPAKTFESILIAIFLLSTNMSCAQFPESGSVASDMRMWTRTLPDTIETQQLELKLNAPTVRIIETYPIDLTTNNDSVLVNFKTQIVVVENELLKIKINQPVIIELPPFQN